MKNILQRLYYGELYESENIIQEKSTQCPKQQERTLKAYDIFMQTLSKEQKEMFEQWQNLDGLDWSDSVEAAYLRGFKIGMLIAIEVHRENETQGTF